MTEQAPSRFSENNCMFERAGIFFGIREDICRFTAQENVIFFEDMPGVKTCKERKIEEIELMEGSLYMKV